MMGSSWQSNPVFENVSSGPHTITISDEQNCELTIEVDVPTCALQLNIDLVPPTDDASNDGMITINAIGANGNVLYSIDGGTTFQSNNVFENIEVGSFNIVVKDAVECQLSENIEVTAPVGIEEISFGRSVQIYPNPTDGVIQVEITGMVDIYRLKFQLYDVQGRLVHHGGLNKYNGVVTGNIAIVAFPSGTYFLKFDHPDLDAIYKVVKN